MHAITTNVVEVINLNKRREVYIDRFGARKGKREML